jgi:2-C-methyl-D-erythritol 4-phosphate cytidylyltransferase
MKTTALIVAGGSSTRFGGDIPKQYRSVCGRPLLAWTVSRFEAAKSIDNVVIVAAEEYLLYISEKIVDQFAFAKVSKIVVGGETRAESVHKGLAALPISTGYVAIHDAARPLVAPADIDRVVQAAIKERAAIMAAPITDTVKRAQEGFILATLDRSRLYGAQTPQVFQYDLIMEAYRRAAGTDMSSFTDDASLVEALGFKVRVVEPTTYNLKVTKPEDLALVESLLKKENHG